MENPNTWTKATIVIDKAIHEWEADVALQWGSLPAYIRRRLVEEGLLSSEH